MSDFEDHETNNLTSTNPITVVAIFMLLLVAGLILYTLSIFGAGMIYGFDLQTLISATNAEDFSREERNFIRISVLTQHLFLFVLPGILTAVFIMKSKWKSYLLLDRLPKLSNSILAMAMILFAFPVVQYSYFLNKSLPLPEWARDIEASTEAMVNGILQANSVWEVLFNLLIIAVLPAIGEEIIFRGLLQDGLSKRMRNPHIAIWLAAFIFSAFHMQFEGFIPRFLLGAVLGYLFYWTQNLWVPIIAHFFNNGAQVIVQHLYSEDISDVDLEQMDHIPLPVVLISLAIITGLGYWIKKNAQPNTNHTIASNHQQDLD